MNSNSVEVVEQEVLLPYLVDSFDMNVIVVQLNAMATVIVNTFDKNKNRLYEKQIVIEGEEYRGWGNNDDYLKNLVASKMGLQIKSSVIDNSNIDNSNVDNSNIDNSNVDNVDNSNVDNVDNSNIDNSNIDNSNIDNSNVDNSDVDNSNIDNSNIDNSNVDNSNVDNPII